MPHPWSILVEGCVERFKPHVNFRTRQSTRKAKTKKFMDCAAY